MYITKYYIAGAILAFFAAFMTASSYFSLMFAWLGLSLGLVSIAYLFNVPSIFRKKDNGSIPIYIRWLFIPFLLGAQLYNSWARRNDTVPSIQQIEDKLFLACRLLPSDINYLKQQKVSAILDVTAEFDGLDWTAESSDLHYLNIPVLDHKAPSSAKLTHAINWIESQINQSRTVVVHCALGRGRSVMVVAAYLLAKHQHLLVVQALAKVQHVRQTAALNDYQLAKLTQMVKQNVVKLAEPITLIANPVAGGGKWPTYQRAVINQLTAKYVVDIITTTPEYSATKATEQALRCGAKHIVACGGDGTVTEVAEQLVSRNVSMGILPMGTANALAHVLLGIQTKVQPVTVACNAILAGNTRKIDTATCNEEPMLLVTGLGFEYGMIAGADRNKKDDGGQFAYVKALLDTVIRNQCLALTLCIDDKEPFDVNTSSLVIANAAPFTTVLAQGGGSPNIADGLLDVTWINDTEQASEQLITLSELALSGISDNVKSSLSKHCTAKKVTVKANEKLDYVVDGEVKEAQEIVVEIIPASLIIYC
ncbi:diacylglycerol kinase family protein [Colwellia sp. MEBiC06753]